MKEDYTLVLEKLRNEDSKRKMAEFRKTSRNKTTISEIKSKLEKNVWVSKQLLLLWESRGSGNGTF